ncbi:MAG TPA: hypothetical protein VLA52_14390 [Thermohalobaculum sp.]|nr:hypothetical protein [Thermohalobaculum sp.]
MPENPDNGDTSSQPGSAQKTVGGSKAAPRKKRAKDAANAGAQADDAQTEATLLERSVNDIKATRVNLLCQSINRAQVLLASSAESNVVVSADVITAITAAQENFGTPAWNATTEQEFWTAYQAISGLLQPVTYESLRWVEVAGKATTKKFIALGFISLLILLVSQVFWVYVNNTSTQIRNSIEQLNKKSAEVNKLEGDVQILSSQIELAAGDLPDGLTRTDVQKRLNQAVSDLNVAFDETERLRRLLNAQFVILADWVPELGSDPKPDGPGWFDTDEEKAAKQIALDKWYASQGAEREFAKEYLLAQAASILALMSTYVLPLFYGALGTVAYILRSVSRGIRERVLNASKVLNFWVRLPLGALSGVAIGWFLNTDTLPTGWASVQPLAIAFVAGYSVELIFTAMDQLVGAFSKGDNEPKR